MREELSRNEGEDTLPPRGSSPRHAPPQAVPAVQRLREDRKTEGLKSDEIAAESGIIKR